MGQTKLLEDLRRDLAKGEVLVIAGTGVSIQATQNEASAQWDGLIANGIEHCVETHLLSEADARSLRKQLKSKAVEDRLAVAEKVSQALGAPDGGEFRRWLRDSVGRLELKDRAIVDAIHALGAPIATTNYDDLLTRGRGLGHVPWTDGPAAHEIIRGDGGGVLHFHGCFDQPASVILGVRSYDTLLASRGAQAIQRAVVANRTLLFIGCGDGLSDPNFGALLEWSAAAFGKSIYRHYCLCLKRERKALQKRRPAEERLFYVEYGDDYSDLVLFLRQLAPAPTPAAVLPNPGYCFGREREVEEVVTALLADKPQPLPILGGPGMGKTTIALKALHDPRVADRFGERRWFIRCDGVKSRTELAAAIARLFDLPITPNVEQAVLAALAKAPGALVLDNGETPLDSDGAQVEELLSILATIASLALVVTIRGHRRPRGVPWQADMEAERLTDAAAAEAFVKVSGKPKFANDPDLSRLLVVLDGVPLAITLMARYAEVFEALGPVWSAWKSKRTAMLKDGEEPDRLRNIAVSYELSIGVLTAEARRLLSILAMLPGGVAYQDLDAVFADADEPAYELRGRALVFDEGQRLRMLAPLREYMSDAHPPEAADEGRVVEHYLRLASDEGTKVGRSAGAIAVVRLTPEIANVEAILAKAVQHHRSPNVVLGWARLIRFTGLGSVGPLGSITDHLVQAGQDQAAHCLVSLAQVARSRYNLDTAQEQCEQALRLFGTINNVRGEATCIGLLADIALQRQDYATAQTRFEEALPLLRKTGHAVGTANCVLGLGDIALERADYEAAGTRFREALALYQQIPHALGQANCLLRLAEAAFRQLEPANDYIEQALPIYREVGDYLGQANCVTALGDIACRTGNVGQGALSYREALALYHRIPEPYAIGEIHRRLAKLATSDAERQGHLISAREAWRSIKRDDLVAQIDAQLNP